MAAQIRSTIELLTSILRENGTSRVRAETFRLAKFDQEDAVTPLWRLIFELLYYCEYGRIDEVAIRAWSKFTTEEQVVYIKREMAERGFYSRDFANLPENQTYGSRELLLSFGWLMCKENVMHRFMSNRTSPLDEDTYGQYKSLEDKAAAQSLDLSIGGRSEPAQRVQQLLWLNNKLRISLRNLYNVQREKLRLKHKMAEATTGVATTVERNHLTAMEIYMLKNPDMLRNNLKLLEKDSERLQHLLQWRSHEDTFWKWMESVLDAKLRNKEQLLQRTESEFSTEDACSLVPSELTSNLVRQHDNLQEAILKYESILDSLETTWKERADDVSEEELDSILASIDLELSIQRASIALNNTDHYLQTQSPPQNFTDIQFIFEKNTQRQNQQLPFAVAHAMAPSSVMSASTATDIQEEITGLQDAVMRLQSEVNNKQDHFRRELEQLSDKLKQAICIPPMEYNI